MGMMNFEVSLPQWAIEENQLLPKFIPECEQRMRTVIRFAEINLDKKTGGPFAAGIFEKNLSKHSQLFFTQIQSCKYNY